MQCTIGVIPIYGFVAADYLRQAKNNLCDGRVRQDPSEHLMLLQSVISAKEVDDTSISVLCQYLPE
jgi:hypothetical protein